MDMKTRTVYRFSPGLCWSNARQRVRF